MALALTEHEERALGRQSYEIAVHDAGAVNVFQTTLFDAT
jgi:hypothetical protein